MANVAIRVYALGGGAGVCRGALEATSTMQSSNACRAASNPWPCPRCHSTRHRRAQAASEHRWVLSRTHWVRPKLVVEVKYLTWTDDNLLRQVVYEGLREDKPAAEIRRPVAHPKPVASTHPLARSKRHRSG